MAVNDFIDGLFEGHEGQGVRWAYRLVIVGLSILTGFCIIINPMYVAMGKPGTTADPLVNSLALIGLLAFMFQNIAWYKRENQSPGHRYGIFALMLCIMVLDIASCIAFNRFVTYVEPTPVYPPPTTTLPPGPTTTRPGPTNKPNATQFMLFH